MAIFDCGQRGTWLLALLIALVFLPSPAAAFGAGNIPSIAQIEGHNFRHGDIEDMLATVAFLGGKKWTTMLMKRVYFGNWLRDYSQGIDVGSLKGPVNAETIRILIWVLSFMAHGYATGEFEVTADRLGVYRAEEHIDNPLGYGGDEDASKLDPRLRGPVRPIETEIDMRTGMKNYIANESGDWATSAGYLRFSLARCIHFGRLYTCGETGKGKEENLCEALRCLGQLLHTLEDWGAHTNYSELCLIEMGHKEVFPHVGSAAKINVRGKTIWPLVTGTFGEVDFLHSVIGEATDHFTQSEVDEVDVALKNAEKSSSGDSSRGFLSSGGGSDFISLVSKLPGVGGGFASEARDLKAASEAQARENERSATRSKDNQNPIPGMSASFDPVKTASRIYPILEFRDKIVKAVSAGVAKIPGLEKLLEHISETLTAFVLGLLAPFIRPIIQQCSKVLKDGSSTIINASAKSQYEPWDNPHCTDPTHSMLSKDHFTNVLNSCGGRVAVTILQYTVPRVLFAWENPNVPVNEVVDDILRAFHHPALRDDRIEIQRNMFNTVRQWFEEHPRRRDIPRMLSAESVRAGKNHILHGNKKRSVGGHSCHGDIGHGKTRGSLWEQVRTRDMDERGVSPGIPMQESYGYHNEGSGKGYGGEAAHAGGEAAGYYGGGSSKASSQGYSPQPQSQSHRPAYSQPQQPTYAAHSYQQSPGYQQPPAHGYQQSPHYQQHPPPPHGYQPPPQGYYPPPQQGGGYPGQQRPPPHPSQYPGQYPGQPSYGYPPYR